MKTIIVESEAWTPGGLLVRCESKLGVEDSILSAPAKRRASIIRKMRESRDHDIREKGYDSSVLRFDEKWRIAHGIQADGTFRRVVPLEWDEVILE